jgi:serine/threonine protein kinase
VILDHSGHVKLVDFGLACALNEPATIATGSAGVGASAASALAAAGQTDAKNNSNCWEEPMALTGSLIYMAPELLARQRGGRQTDW